MNGLISLVAIVVALAATAAGAGENAEMLKRLSRLWAQSIPQVDCEVNGAPESQDGMLAYKPVTVGDFIASYVAWSLDAGERSRRSMKCEGKDTLECTLSYGRLHSDQDPGWDRILLFHADRKTKRIDPKSLRCVDVP
ncbi:MAG: hypothetical protein HYZ75_17325 [Elusimicrobia bacterium]|nr:hypothetical protein [Elusimicrobiota bacterium]